MYLIQALLLILLHCTKIGNTIDLHQFENLWKSYYVLPSELLNSHDLSAMGLHNDLQELRNLNTINLGKTFRLNIPVASTGISVPYNSSLLFLFNSSSVGSSENNLFNAAGQYVHTGLPLNLPKYHFITSVFMMIPIELVRDGHLERFPYVRSDLWLSQIGIPRHTIPLHNDLLKYPRRPMLTFVFQSGSAAEDFSAFGSASNNSDYTDSLSLTREKISDAFIISSSQIAKAILFNNDEFFDRFANVWTRSFGIENLFQSVFCQVDLRVSEMSYCLQLSPSGADIFIFDKSSSTGSLEDSPKFKRALLPPDNMEKSVLAAEEMFPIMMSFFQVMTSNYSKANVILQNCKL